MLSECSSPTPSPGKEWEEYQQIRALVERIRKKQKGIREKGLSSCFNYIHLPSVFFKLNSSILTCVL